MRLVYQGCKAMCQSNNISPDIYCICTWPQLELDMSHTLFMAMSHFFHPVDYSRQSQLIIIVRQCLYCPHQDITCKHMFRRQRHEYLELIDLSTNTYINTPLSAGAYERLGTKLYQIMKEKIQCFTFSSEAVPSPVYIFLPTSRKMNLSYTEVLKTCIIYIHCWNMYRLQLVQLALLPYLHVTTEVILLIFTISIL